MSWPLSKIYGYMAFYVTESEEFKKAQKNGHTNSDGVMAFDEIVRLMERDGLLKNE